MHLLVRQHGQRLQQRGLNLSTNFDLVHLVLKQFLLFLHLVILIQHLRHYFLFPVNVQRLLLAQYLGLVICTPNQRGNFFLNFFLFYDLTLEWLP